MTALEALLSTEVIAGILIIAAFAMGIRSILHFTSQAAGLRPKLDEVTRELKRLRSGMSERKKAVEKLAKVVAPVQEREATMREYFEEIQQLGIDMEKQEAEQSVQDEANRRRRVQRKKMGFEGDE
jgi:hypothetical protein